MENKIKKIDTTIFGGNLGVYGLTADAEKCILFADAMLMEMHLNGICVINVLLRVSYPSSRLVGLQ